MPDIWQRFQMPRRQAGDEAEHASIVPEIQGPHDDWSPAAIAFIKASSDWAFGE